jgi:hypothetical protein
MFLGWSINLPYNFLFNFVFENKWCRCKDPVVFLHNTQYLTPIFFSLKRLNILTGYRVKANALE